MTSSRTFDSTDDVVRQEIWSHRIFLAEPDASLRGEMGDELRSDGHYVVEIPEGPAFFGSDDWSGSGWGIPEVVVCRVSTPGSGERETWAILRGVRPRKPIIVLISGDARGEPRARRLGAAAVLRSPIDVTELRAVVYHLLREGLRRTAVRPASVGTSRL